MMDGASLTFDQIRLIHKDLLNFIRPHEVYSSEVKN